MARKFLTPVDLTGLELLNARFQQLASDPGGAVAGRFYYNTTTNKFVYHNGTNFVDPTARTNHTGTQLAATISDFDTQVRVSRLDQMAAPTAAVALNAQRLTGVADPTAAQDAATKNYVDNLVNGTDWKQSVRAATTANLAALSGLLTLDGVTVVAGDRVLVKDQTTASQNGLYVAASGAWSRTTDADGAGEVTAGMAVMVTEGTTLADTQWRLLTNDPITLGTTALSFAQIGAGSSYVQGTGIVVSGNTISIDTTVTARKVSGNLTGNGSLTSFTLTHNFANRDGVAVVREDATNDEIDCDVNYGLNAVTFVFAVAPTNGTVYRATFVG